MQNNFFVKYIQKAAALAEIRIIRRQNFTYITKIMDKVLPTTRLRRRYYIRANSKIVDKVPDARNSDDGVQSVLLGAIPTQMVL